MNKDQAKEYILDHSKDYFSKARKEGYICPICRSGLGKSGTGITTEDGAHFTCWAGCFTHADIFQIIGIEKNLSSFPDQMAEACRFFQIEVDGKEDPSLQARQKPEAKPFPEMSFQGFYDDAHSHIDDTTYHRGLSKATLDHFNVGYVEKWKQPLELFLAGKEGRTEDSWSRIPFSSRLIIPVTEHSYIARATREDPYPKQKCKGAEKVSWLFNKEALYGSDPVFIVEGEIDAMSIYEVGGQAVALGSVAYINGLVSACKEKRPSVPLIVALDNDQAGEKASGEILEELSKLGLSLYRRDITATYKDPNEFLEKDHSAFREAVHEAVEAVLSEFNEKDEATTQELYKTSVKSVLDSFRDRFTSGAPAFIVPTGFSELDRILSGGLRQEALYALGAVSSLGKTSFILQMADNIASQGIPVLYVALEMSREELTAKLISRETFELSRERTNSSTLAQTTARILDTHKYKDLDQEAQAVVMDAMKRIEARSDKLFILEGLADIGTDQIREEAEKIRTYTGSAPVIIVDYLQILQPGEASRGKTDKQLVDMNVVELKRLARALRVPVVVISSFNRDNYNNPVNEGSFKESGAIEYTSDVLLGLQLAGMDFQDGESSEGRSSRINQLKKKARYNGSMFLAQDLELKILKNRNGNKGSVKFAFTPAFNHYKEIEDGSGFLSSYNI